MNFVIPGKKTKNPIENANCLSISTMFYTIPFFKLGCQKKLEVNDLYETLPEHRSYILGDKIEVEWNLERKNALLSGRKPSIKRVLIKLFGIQFFCYGLIAAFSELVIKMIQPLALGKLIQYYIENRSGISKQELYLSGGLIVFCSLVNVFILNPYVLGLVNLGMKIRLSCSSLIYRKALKLDISALGVTTIGQIVNLLSKDVHRFDTFGTFSNYLWITPIQVILVTYFVYQQVGFSAIAGTLSILLFVPFQSFLGNRIAVFRLKTVPKTDKRIRLVNEIINGIQLIKMYAWETYFVKLVTFARRFEMQPIRRNAYILGILSALNLIMCRFSIYVTILVYVLFNDDINAIQVFVLTAFLNVLKLSVSVYFAYGIGRVAETNASIKRINNYLLLEENNNEIYSNDSGIFNKQFEKCGVSITNGTVKWSKNSKDNSLFELTFSVKRGILLGVVGPAGSGKTTLLHTILRELPLITGSLNVNGKVSYASQDPWIFPGSICQNILFGLPMEHLRYQIVIRKCDLDYDLSRFLHGDKTVIGENGMILTRGQRARINLARALYKDADIYLLDDPLSAVDVRTGKQLFEDCVCNFLRGKTVIFVTRQLEYLKNIDQIIILKNGQIQKQGSLGELQNTGVDLEKILGSNTNIQEEIDVLASNKPRIRSSSSNKVPNKTEPKHQDSVSTYKAYLCFGSSWYIILLIITLFVISQIAGSGGDLFLSYWVNQEQNLWSKYPVQNSSQGADVVKFDDYLKIARHLSRTSLYVYSTLMIILIVASLVRSFSYYAACMRSSTKLHDKMFEKILHGTMKCLYPITSDQILNCFSKDIRSIDGLLPPYMMEYITIVLTILGVLVVVVIVNPILLIPAVIFGIFFSRIKKVYVTTSSNVRRLEEITRTPIFAYLASSIQGVTTIRAYGVQDILEKEFDSYQDLHSSAWFLYLLITRAFGFALDLLCVACIAVVTFSYFFNNEQLGGNVGLAITQVLGLTGILQWGVKQSTETEKQMPSVERILEYKTLDQEEIPLESKPPNLWPKTGTIKFVNLELRYFNDEAPVLKKLNFTIHSGEKIGIVGRTGAGKSSIVSALFGLAETEGSILIDDVAIENIALRDLRSKISIIPQDPILFSGTLRRNLDPFNEYSDKEIWKALEEVELKDEVEGLNMMISDGGTNFSVGQRRLVCLARTIIRSNHILILDEATVSVDPHTDALIRSTIRIKFYNCTVLTIARRLFNIMDFDKVLVMDEGKLVEFDPPSVLLQNSDGYLYKMVEESGHSISEVLETIPNDISV